MITSPLYDLIHTGDLAAVRAWLNENPEDLNAWISDGFTPLHVACIFGYEDIVRDLLSRMALVNVNAMNSSRATPLHLAVSFRDEEIADRVSRVLIDNGAELNAQQSGGQTPLHHAVARGSKQLVDTLVEAGADPFLEDEQGRSASDVALELESNKETAQNVRAALKKAFSLSSSPT